MFNAVFKIPMQFFILLLGVLIFVFYQFERPPVYFNQAPPGSEQAARRRAPQLRAARGGVRRRACGREDASSRRWLAARHAGDAAAADGRAGRGRCGARARRGRPDRGQGRRPRRRARARPRTTPTTSSSPSSSTYLPHGLIGLLVTAFFAAALSSKAAELNALGSTTTVDFYRHLVRREATDAHYVGASKWFTALWGLVAIAFALFANLAENLIQAVNIIGSIFYGVVARALPRRLLPEEGRRHGGLLGGAGGAGPRLRALRLTLKISYLWYNVIGCAACMLLSLLIQAAIGPGEGNRQGDGPGMTRPRHLLRPAALRLLPAAFLAAKFFTARRLQAELGGEIVFFCHDSDHDPRETQTTLRHRSTGEARTLNFTFENKIQRKFSPLFAKRIPRRLEATTRPASSRPSSTRAGSRPSGRCTAANVADFCLEMYRQDGPPRGDPRRPLGRPGIPAGGLRRGRVLRRRALRGRDRAGPIRRWRVATARGRGFIRHSSLRALRQVPGQPRPRHPPALDAVGRALHPLHCGRGRAGLPAQGGRPRDHLRQPRPDRPVR